MFSCCALLSHYNFTFLTAIVPFTGSSDGTIRVWTMATKECTLKIQGYAGKLSPIVTWANRVAAEVSGVTGTLQVWDTTSGEVLSKFEGHTKQISCIDGEKGRYIATGTRLVMSNFIFLILDTTNECAQSLTIRDSSVTFII